MMNKRKILYITVLSVIAISCLWAFIASSIITRNFKKEIFSGQVETEKLNIKDLIVIETKNEKKYWEIYAQSGYYNGNTKAATLNDVIGNFFDNDEVTLSFKAKKATFEEQVKKINLSEDSLIVYKDGTSIKADNFEWTGKENDITARGNIKIEKKDSVRAYGDSAILSNKMTKFTLSGKTKTELYSKENLK